MGEIIAPTLQDSKIAVRIKWRNVWKILSTVPGTQKGLNKWELLWIALLSGDTCMDMLRWEAVINWTAKDWNFMSFSNLPWVLVSAIRLCRKALIVSFDTTGSWRKKVCPLPCQGRWHVPCCGGEIRLRIFNAWSYRRPRPRNWWCISSAKAGGPSGQKEMGMIKPASFVRTAG